jgi:hypothetical protein
MRPFMQLVLIMSLAALAGQQVTAFSLVGPDTTWMTVRLGYDIGPGNEPLGQGAGFAGPMNIGEEYRINYPTVTWGCSPTFLNYFGLRGLQEIQKAVDILNALPSADTININDYPVSAERINFRAQSLQLFDLKSTALSVLVNHMGLTDPDRFVFTLRERWIPPGASAPTNYYVIKRNFDPDTWTYSSYINGQLWTYTEIIDGPTDSLVINEPVDPAAYGGVVTAPVASGVSGYGLLLMGGFWTGLTRDDVGGLRYIYRRSNFNNENAPTNSVLGGSGAVVAGGSSSPWTIPNYGTNTAGTGGTVIPGQGTNIVDLALRPGIGKVQFVHMIEESQIGSFISNTVSWVDTFITNGVARSQNLVHTATAPDVLFDAGDINGGDTGSPPGAFPFALVGSVAWQSTGNGTTTYGPGTIPPAGAGPALTYTFNDTGPTYWNVFQGSPLLSEANALLRFFLWGTFDGSAADPIVYPQTESIQAIEQMVIGGGAGGVGGGTAGPQVGIWTPASIILLPVGTTPGGGTGTGTGTGTGGGAGAGGTGGIGG